MGKEVFLLRLSRIANTVQNNEEEFCWKIKIMIPPKILAFFVFHSSLQSSIQDENMWFSPWLCGFEGLLVRFPVRAHAWVAALIPAGAHAQGNQSIFLSHISASLPLPPLSLSLHPLPLPF